MIAVQFINSGQLVDIYPNMESARSLLESNNNLEGIKISPYTPKIEVNYIEVSGPNGYGCNTPEFTTYNSSARVCLINLYKWTKECCKTFGPDPYDVKKFFEHCHVYYKGEVNITKKYHDFIDELLKDNPIFM